MPFDDTSIAVGSLLLLTRLKKARHRIRLPQLWCKGNIESGGRRCIIGAFPSLRHDIWLDVRELLLAHIPIRYELIENFNDAPETRHEDVLAVFDAAIADLESK